MCEGSIHRHVCAGLTHQVQGLFRGSAKRLATDEGSALLRAVAIALAANCKCAELPLGVQWLPRHFVRRRLSVALTARSTLHVREVVQHRANH